eukprot:162879-Amphidinium_carterae.1
MHVSRKEENAKDAQNQGDGKDLSRVEHCVSGETLHFRYKQRVWELDVEVLPSGDVTSSMPLNTVHPTRQGYP